MSLHTSTAFLAFLFLIFLFLSSVPVFSTEEETAVSGIWPKPGNYTEDILVSFPGAAAELSYRVELSDHSLAGFQSYQEPFLLSALEGEERTYTIRLQDGRSFSYCIDKRKPLPPQIEEEEESKIHIHPSEEDLLTYVRIYPLDRSRDLPFQEWTGVPLDLPDSSSNIIKVEAYSVDPSGNRSALGENYFEKPYSADSDIPILSPVAGVFLNPQLFYIDTRGYQWLRYTIDGTDPVLYGAPYLGPLLVRSRGVSKLMVAGLPVGSTKPVRSEVLFAQYPQGNSSLPASGVYSNALAFELPESVKQFSTVEEAPPTRDNQGSLTIRGIQGALSLHPLRFLPETLPEDLPQELPSYTPEYRYLYVMDNRKPAAPRMILDDSLPFSKPLTVTLQAGEGETIYYTLNGTTPDRFSLKYQRPFTIDPKQWGDQGAVELRALSYSEMGVSGRELGELLPYDTIPPGVPRITVEETGTGQYRITAQMAEEEETGTIHYSLSFGEAVAIPDASSPVMKDALSFTVPRGSEDKAFFSFLAIDNAGNPSPQAAKTTISWDLLPPPEVSIGYRDTQVELSAPQGMIEYRLVESSPFDEVDASDTLNTGDDGWTRYEGPLELQGREGELVSYTILCRSKDDSGNASRPDRAGPWLVDRRTSFSYSLHGIPETTVKDQVVLSCGTDPFTRLHLKLLRQEVGSSREAELLHDAPWDNHLIIQGDDGKDYQYKLSVYPFSVINGEKGNTETRMFTIDQKAPDLEIPEISSSVLLKGNKSLFLSDFGMKNPVSSGDTVQLWAILLSAGNNDSSEAPALSRELFFRLGKPVGRDGKIPLAPAIDGGSYSLFFMALDDTGNSTIPSRFIPVIRDTTAPATPSFQVERDDMGDSWKLFPQAKENDDAAIFLEGRETPLSEDESFITDQEGSYRFYAEDRAGNRSSHVTYTISGKALFKDGILVDTAGQTGKGSSPETVQITENPLQIPEGSLVSGIPRYFWSGEDITIRPGNLEGTLRYELSLGSEAADVTAGSDILDKSLTISAEEGDAFYVSLSLALFKELGGEEKLIVRERHRFGIDRNDPVPPSIFGIEAGAYYRDDRTINLFHDEPEVQSIRYRIIREQDSGKGGTFLTYTDPVKIASREGTFSEYTLEAYAVDEAGNRSDTRSCRFAIDKAVLYVASSAPSTGGDGSRGSPYHSLELALNEARKEGMSTIILSSGKHRLHAPLEIGDTTLTIRGGFSYPGWERSEANSALVSNGNFGKKPIFTVTEGSLSLENVSIDNLTSGEAILNQQGGQVRMDRVSLYQASGAVAAALSIQNGTFHFADGSIRFGPLSRSSLISLRNGRGSFVSSSIVGTGGSRESTLIDLFRGSLALDNTTINPGEGNRIVSVRAREGSISLVSSEIMGSDNDSRSTLLNLDNSDMYMLSSSLLAGQGGRIAFLLEAENSIITLEKSLFLGGDTDGTVQMSIQKSSVTGSEMVFTNRNETSTFLYGIQADGSTLDFSRSIFFHKTGGDIITFDLKNGSRLKLSESSCGIERAGSNKLLLLLRQNGGSSMEGANSSFHYGPTLRPGALFSPESSYDSLRSVDSNNFLLLPGPAEAPSAGSEPEVLFDLWSYGAGDRSSPDHPLKEWPELYRRMLSIDPVR